MIEVEFDIVLDDTGDPSGAPWLDQFEIAQMLEHTKSQINQHVQNSLGDLRCEQHHQQAKVRVTGSYSLETEQLDVSYHVDTCCKPFLMQAVMALNRG